MAVYATVEDLRTRWGMVPPYVTEDAMRALLQDASYWLEASFSLPDVVVDPLAGVLRTVVVNMAKRALQGDGHEGMERSSATAGPFSVHTSYRNSDGALFLTTQERAMITAALARTGVTAARSFEADGW